MANVQAYVRDTDGLVPDHRNTASIAMKQALIVFLVESLAVNLKKTVCEVK